ncbi:hypothetical protein SARC_03414 [Sphaeroforma arctica JP610]|uniref:Fe2OG dioxygenase domain-containing protein n=1 Tax=Sphaeroforma arctica JP610 TaxID=667725 RepID=A0A0L0G5Z2_9EUKA|nr:hypothetical protein SARC_03414 [Sphaeroforma arctica JP610]KNC84369.1 hypothetical protein SARC_03414 [Sphaeroforma arctica JP610]|eukprot:XP_014158271.1 hypothetical protein SARC_03414 [Sphaeroforma arctica JP610]
MKKRNVKKAKDTWTVPQTLKQTTVVFVKCPPLIPEPRGYSKPVQLNMDKEYLYKDTIYTLTNFLSDSECAAWIEFGEREGFEASFQKQNRECAHRDNGRISIESESIAQAFFLRLNPSLPEKYGTRQLNSCNTNIRLYKYGPGQRFGRHVDESVVDSNGRKSVYTVLVYLNGHNEDNTSETPRSGDGADLEAINTLVGGETKFYRRHHGSAIACAVRPKKGQALLHGHGAQCLTHEGAEVKEGVKYLLRTDVMYA